MASPQILSSHSETIPATDVDRLISHPATGRYLARYPSSSPIVLMVLSAPRMAGISASKTMMMLSAARAPC